MEMGNNEIFLCISNMLVLTNGSQSSHSSFDLSLQATFQTPELVFYCLGGLFFVDKVEIYLDAYFPVTLGPPSFTCLRTFTIAQKLYKALARGIRD